MKLVTVGETQKWVGLPYPYFKFNIILVDLHTLSGNIIISSIPRVSTGFYKTLDDHVVIEFCGFPTDPLGVTLVVETREGKD